MVRNHPQWVAAQQIIGAGRIGEVRSILGSFSYFNDDPQNIRLNFWAHDTFFKAAYDASLVPAAAPEDNEIYFYEVDWVKIRRPLPLSARLRPWAGPALGVLAVLAVAVAIVRRSRA